MPATYKLIEAKSVGAGGASSITFASIPQIYTDLMLQISARSTRPGTYEGGLGVAINGNSSSGYSYYMLEAQGTSVVGSNTPYEIDWASRIPASQTTSSVFSNTEIYIVNYTLANQKNYIAEGVGENLSNTASLTLNGIKQTTTSAITSIVLREESGNVFTQYTTATLYGIKNA